MNTILSVRCRSKSVIKKLSVLAGAFFHRISFLNLDHHEIYKDEKQKFQTITDIKLWNISRF